MAQVFHMNIQKNSSERRNKLVSPEAKLVQNYNTTTQLIITSVSVELHANCAAKNFPNIFLSHMFAYSFPFNATSKSSFFFNNKN